MKKVIFTLTLFSGLFFAANTVSARGVIIYSNGEKVEKVQDLPADAIMDDGNHVNVGVMYEQFSIFWVPMWNYGETKYVLINDKEDSYYDVTAENIKGINEEFNVNLSAEPSIGFWNKIGGKLIWAVVFAVIIYGLLPSRKDKEEENEEETETPQQEEQE